MQTRILFGMLFVILLGVAYLIKTAPEEKKIVAPVVANDSICLAEAAADSFNVKDFVWELHLQGIKYPDVVLRQACLESGFFTSEIWREKNNPFGFYYDSTYIIFNDWRASISYYKSWQDKRYKGGDYDYYDFLYKVGYAKDTTYLEAVKKIDLKNLK